MAYSEKVMDHFQHPRNVGEIENASGVGTVGNAKCGDIMRIFLISMMKHISSKTANSKHSDVVRQLQPAAWQQRW